MNACIPTEMCHGANYMNELYWDSSDLLQCKNACRRIIRMNQEEGFDEEENLNHLIELQEEGYFGNLDVVAVWDEEMN